jgi:dephospho-CoA kinase
MSVKTAITGSIGSGKTLFSEYLRKKGYPVIIADDISKNILAGDKDVRELVIKEFGSESFTGGSINKKYLAETVFSDPDKVVKINSILHPRVIEKTDALLKEYSAGNKLIFVEAALIYEADMESLFDYVVLVTADENTRKQRKVAFDKFSEEDFIKRNNNQIPDEEKKKRADFVFINSGTKEDLYNKADLLINILNGLKS